MDNSEEQPGAGVPPPEPPHEPTPELRVPDEPTPYSSGDWSASGTVESRTPAPAVDAAVIARGKAVFDNKCLTCHSDDLVKQQRLGKAGWTREVEKMTRWGAEVSDEEKTVLVEYLLSQNNSAKK